ncbi:hypothetical protein CWI39_0243p0010 [Hamiltosporidium magnivora]|uniref:Uncharacterized protein n=1 Tax=Hamiltosporidium magnivora TaxID=148818 RepID=A0A4Q9LIZ5_9MICR|nr:hypothetical protein CWI39_0243p0010 [Hamiltosporidium magnivora]
MNKYLDILFEELYIIFGNFSFLASKHCIELINFVSEIKECNSVLKTKPILLFKEPIQKIYSPYLPSCQLFNENISIYIPIFTNHRCQTLIETIITVKSPKKMNVSLQS